MSKIITTIDKTIYDALYNLQTYSEKRLQNWLDKYKQILFADYYCFQSGYVFKNKKGQTSAADLILIARDFSEWILVEVELSNKGLTHTSKQIEVFIDVNLDLPAFSNHCQRKEPVFHKKYQKQLESCIAKTPKVLVIFDYEVSKKISELKKAFPQIKVSFCELYMTTKHNATILRVYGETMYIKKKSVYLTPGPVNKSIYDISEIDFFKNQRIDKIDVICEGRLNQLILIKVTNNKIKVKIDDHPYNSDSILILEQTTSNKFHLRAVN